MKTLPYILLFIYLSFCCCNNDAVVIPDDVIPSDTMIILLTEAQIIEAAVQKKIIKQEKTDPAGKAYFTDILNKHHIPEEDFKKSFDFYKTHPDMLVQIYDGVLEEISKKQALLKRGHR